MRLRDQIVDRIIGHLPWYDRIMVEARHARSRRIIRNANRTVDMVESYRQSSERLRGKPR